MNRRKISSQKRRNSKDEKNTILKRRDFIKIFGLGTAGFTISRCTGTSGKRPNIIFILADDHDLRALSCYGSRINKTPNLDRIAAQGVRFNNCFCTNSLCAPSRAVILTGKYSHVNGVINNGRRFDGSQQTFPKLLQQAGYETAMIGKWHLKTDPTGFDYWNVLPGQGEYYNPELIEMGEKKRHDGYATDIITDISLRWLKGRSGDRPFCLMYHHKAPHANWQPGPKHRTLYDDVEIPEPETFNDDLATRSEAVRTAEMTIERHLDLQYNKVDPKIRPPKGLKGQALKKWKYQLFIKDYLRCIASIDDNVGRVLDYLDTAGLAENTVVVYTSDQGFLLGDHGLYDKRFMYEMPLHMPLLVRYPKEIKPGTINNDMVLNLDFAPTFLDFAGNTVPEDIQGRSFRKILRGKTPGDWRQSMYYHYYEYPGWHMVKRHYGIRTHEYKLIHFYYDIDAWELYDLQKDPNELNNVYDNPDYENVVKELKTELERLRKQYGDSDELTQEILENNLKRGFRRPLYRNTYYEWMQNKFKE